MTRPVLFTVATPGADDNQGLVAAGLGDPVSCVVPPMQIFKVPVMVGDGLITKFAAVRQPACTLEHSA